MLIEENRSGSAVKKLLVVTAAAFGAPRHPAALFPPHAPCTVVTNAVAGGAMVATLATRALAPSPALEASSVAAEKMEPFKVRLTPCCLSPALRPRPHPLQMLCTSRRATVAVWVSPGALPLVACSPPSPPPPSNVMCFLADARQ